MHSRRLACLLLGLWLAGDLYMGWLTRQNLHSLDRLMERPNPAAFLPFRTRDLSSAAKALVHYVEAEQNRFYAESWETAQILLGMLFFFFLLFGTNEDKYTLLLVLAMLLLTLFQRFWMTPQLTSLGRVTDYSPDAPGTAERVRIHVLQSGYTVLELVKGAFGLALALRLVFSHTRSRSDRDIRKELDLIDKANYRHINR